MGVGEGQDEARGFGVIQQQTRTAHRNSGFTVGLQGTHHTARVHQTELPRHVLGGDGGELAGNWLVSVGEQVRSGRVLPCMVSMVPVVPFEAETSCTTTAPPPEG